MFSKAEASQVRQQFWTSFGQYMKPVPGAEGTPVNWLNYKTGVKGLYFRMDADKNLAAVSVEVDHPDPGMRRYYFSKLISLKAILEESTAEQWQWEPDAADEHGRLVSRVIVRLSPVNIFNQSDWPRIISFFKPRILALDKFWSVARDLMAP